MEAEASQDEKGVDEASRKMTKPEEEGTKKGTKNAERKPDDQGDRQKEKKRSRFQETSRERHDKKYVNGVDCTSGTSFAECRRIHYRGTNNPTSRVFQVPTLERLSTRALFRNVNSLEYLGPIPWQFVRPLFASLRKPEQLRRLEEFNPQFAVKSAALWERFCAKDFRANKRHDHESWKEMYWRCDREHKEKFNAVVGRIKAKLAVQEAEKQARIARILIDPMPHIPEDGSV